MNKEQKVEDMRVSPADGKPPVIGSCFCGKPAITYAFDTYFCQQHDDELAKSFEARMNMPDKDFEGVGGA